jgi:hypothetical protein
MRDFLVDLSNIIVRVFKVCSHPSINACDTTFSQPPTYLLDGYNLF